jgi:predicted RNase H-like HicB family nuclease
MMIRKVFQTYTIRVEPSEIDGGYIARVLEVPGCLSQGDGFQEAMENILEALTLMLETQGQRNVTIRRPGRVEERARLTEVPVEIQIAA